MRSKRAETAEKFARKNQTNGDNEEPGKIFTQFQQSQVATGIGIPVITFLKTKKSYHVTESGQNNASAFIDVIRPQTVSTIKKP